MNMHHHNGFLRCNIYTMYYERAQSSWEHKRPMILDSTSFQMLPVFYLVWRDGCNSHWHWSTLRGYATQQRKLHMSTFSFRKIHLKILFEKRWPFFLGLNALTKAAYIDKKASPVSWRTQIISHAPVCTIWNLTFIIFALWQYIKTKYVVGYFTI